LHLAYLDYGDGLRCSGAGASLFNVNIQYIRLRLPHPVYLFLFLIQQAFTTSSTITIGDPSQYITYSTLTTNFPTTLSRLLQFLLNLR